MARRFVDQLADGDTIDEIYLVTEKQLRANRNGNLYLQMDLRDRSGVIPARMWNAGEPLFRTFNVGDFLMIRGKVQLHQGSLQVIVSALEKSDADKIELGDFLPHTEKDVAKLYERLRTKLFKLSNFHLKALAQCYLMDDDFVKDFCRCPAGVRIHHAYVGGLLEHVVSMIEVGERILPLYPEVDHDLLMIGIFLHDSGKIRELTFARAFGYSEEGQLIGHLAIGLQMLLSKLAQVPELTGEPFPRELALRLQHMILSHHGELEYGSPKVPMTLEALLLHQIDMLDSRVAIFQREIKEDRNSQTAWTPFNPTLQRRIYKGGSGFGDSFTAATPETFD